MTDALIAHIIECLHAAFVRTGGVPNLEKIDATMSTLVDLGRDQQIIRERVGSFVASVFPMYLSDTSERNTTLEYYWVNALAHSPGWLVTALKEIQILCGLLSDAQTETGLVEQGKALGHSSAVEFLDYLETVPDYLSTISSADLLCEIRDAVRGSSTEDQRFPLAAANAEVLRLRYSLRRITVEAGEVAGSQALLTGPKPGIARCELVARIAEEALGVEP